MICVVERTMEPELGLVGPVSFEPADAPLLKFTEFCGLLDSLVGPLTGVPGAMEEWGEVEGEVEAGDAESCEAVFWVLLPWVAAAPVRGEVGVVAEALALEELDELEAGAALDGPAEPSSPLFFFSNVFFIEPYADCGTLVVASRNLGWYVRSAASHSPRTSADAAERLHNRFPLLRPKQYDLLSCCSGPTSLISLILIEPFFFVFSLST